MPTLPRPAFAATLLSLAAGQAIAQPACGRVGPDLIIADIHTAVSYGVDNGRAAWSLGPQLVNVGNMPINVLATSSNHPVVGAGLYRLTTASGYTRLEQIGRSWLFHTYFALGQNQPCGTCLPGSGNQFRPGCSTSDSASITGQQTNLGPTWQVNAFTGAFTFPPADPPFAGPIARRLQASTDDLIIGPDTSYLVELHALSIDDAAADNAYNNASYRPCILTPTTYAMILSGATVPEQPAISAWKAADPQVTQTNARIPGEGTFIVSSRATDLGNGMWHYEFAVYNANSNLCAGAFSVPLPASAALANVGFYDVDYTDGDGLNNITHDGADWRATRDGDTLTWSTTPFATDPNANALRWGSLYNFRFDTDAPPASGDATLTLWKTPGVSLAVAAQVPAAACYPNCDGSTTAPVLNVNDFICFQAAFAAGDPYANCDNSTTAPILNVNDFICFQTQFVAGCP